MLNLYAHTKKLHTPAKIAQTFFSVSWKNVLCKKWLVWLWGNFLVKCMRELIFKDEIHFKWPNGSYWLIFRSVQQNEQIHFYCSDLSNEIRTLHLTLQRLCVKLVSLIDEHQALQKMLSSVSYTTGEIERTGMYTLLNLPPLYCKWRFDSTFEENCIELAWRFLYEKLPVALHLCQNVWTEHCDG